MLINCDAVRYRKSEDVDKTKYISKPYICSTVAALTQKLMTTDLMFNSLLYIIVTVTPTNIICSFVTICPLGDPSFCVSCGTCEQ